MILITIFFRPKKTLVVGGLCLIGFILGLPLCCPGISLHFDTFSLCPAFCRLSLSIFVHIEIFDEGGSLLLDLLDTYAAVWPYLFIGLS